jgi:hypothetical protein
MNIEPVHFGGFLGLLDVLVIAVGIAATYATSELLAVAVIFAACAILAGVVIGAFVGSLADRCARSRSGFA